MNRNRHGLGRDIPATVKREVRRRSRFGCVICRSGFYTYEHIDPLFSEAREHDPSAICCLCGSCHDAVTRGRISKALVKHAYEAIQYKNPAEVEPPRGPLDFHDGSAELHVGGLRYTPAVSSLLRYHDHDLITVTPGHDGNPGTISAVFLDASGQVALRLQDNEWVGSTTGWDLEVVGSRLRVAKKKGQTSLTLRLDPPGRVVVEWLDMRLPDAHVLVTEKTYLVGRYLSPVSTPQGTMFRVDATSPIDQLVWSHASIEIVQSNPHGCAIEITDPSELAERYAGSTEGTELSTQESHFTIKSGFGVSVLRAGLTIASGCHGFKFFGGSFGFRSLEHARRAVKEMSPSDVLRFVGEGCLTHQPRE